MDLDHCGVPALPHLGAAEINVLSALVGLLLAVSRRGKGPYPTLWGA